MKKFLLAIAILISALGCNIAYATDIALTDPKQDTITLSGTAESSSTVTLMILNPGYSFNDAFTNASNAVQYLRTVEAVDDCYSFDVTMNVTEGGSYAVYTTIGDTLSPVEYFDYYPYSVKLSAIDEVNSASNIDSALIDKIAKYYSLANNDVFKSAGSAEVARVLTRMKSQTTNSRFDSEPNTFYNSLLKAVILAGYNTGSQQVFKDTEPLYADVLGLSTLDIYADFTAYVSSSGKASLLNAMLNNSYNSVSDLQDDFSNLTAYYLIKSYYKSGSGHVKGFLSKYKTIYAGAGFKLKDSISSTVCSTLVSSSAKNLTELANVYNKAVTSSTTSGGGGSSGGGGGGGSAYVSTSELTKNTTITDDTIKWLLSVFNIKDVENTIVQLSKILNK